MSQLEGYALDKFLDEVLSVRAGRRAPHLSKQETELLLIINTPLEEHIWERYTKLYAALRADRLTESEHTELMHLIDVVEIDNAKRIEHLIKLAHLRGTTLDDLMQSLGIGPRAHA
ncbi:MAG: hypothetical protein ACRYFS_06170 [Janthinobacterium lividum]